MNDHFFRIPASTQVLLFQSSYIFREAAFFELQLFQKYHFFTAIYFQIRFQSETSNEQLILETRQFFRAVNFSKKLPFWWRNLLRIKISTEELFFRTRYFCAGSTFQNSCFFSKITSSQETLFQSSYFSDVVQTFYRR